MPLRIRETEVRIAAGSRRGVERAGEHLVTESRDLAPREEGDLRRSGRCTVLADDHAAVHYGSTLDGYDYSVVQHEALDFYHDDGQAKYLEEPFYTEAQTCRALMAEAIREVLA